MQCRPIWRAITYLTAPLRVRRVHLPPGVGSPPLLYHALRACCACSCSLAPPAVAPHLPLFPEKKKKRKAARAHAAHSCGVRSLCLGATPTPVPLYFVQRRYSCNNSCGLRVVLWASGVGLRRARWRCACCARWAGSAAATNRQAERSAGYATHTTFILNFALLKPPLSPTYAPRRDLGSRGAFRPRTPWNSASAMRMHMISSCAAP